MSDSHAENRKRRRLFSLLRSAQPTIAIKRLQRLQSAIAVMRKHIDGKNMGKR